MESAANAVVIIGGGLSGLCAAAQLGRLGMSAVLFEDHNEVGGRARTECRDGFQLNFGPHRLYERGAAVVGLRALGVPIDGAPRGPNGGLAMFGGRKHTLPVGCCSLLTTGLLGAAAKREIARLLASIPSTDTSGLQDVPIAEWLRTQVCDLHVTQLVLAFIRFTTYCDEPDRQSAAAAIEQLKLSLTGAVLYVHHGWRSIAVTLRAAAESTGTRMVVGQRVAAINVDHGHAHSVTLADGTCLGVRAVIVAVGPSQLDRLFGKVGTSAVLATPVRVAALDIALRSLPVPGAVFALGIDEPVCFSADSVIARVAPGSGAVVHLAKYLRAGTSATRTDEDQLERVLDLVQPGWRDLIVHRRFLSNAVVSHALVAADQGGFAGRPLGRVPHIENVFLAGDWVGPVGQLADASVASGIEAAYAVKRLAASWQESDGT